MATPNKTIDNERVIDALVGQESGGRYDAINESYDKGRKRKVYAVGKYQIMDYNLPEWTRKHLGRELSVQEFLANPEAQDRVGRGQINEYYSSNLSRYNDPTLAAQETALDWYGRGTPSEGPHPDEYARQVLRRLGSNYERIASKPDTVALSSAIEEAKKKAPYGVVFVAGGKIRDYTGAEIGDVPTLGKVQSDTSNEHEEAKKAVEAFRSGGSAPITPSELNLDALAKYSPTGLKGGLTNLTPQLQEVAKANLGLTFDVSAIKNELPPKPGVYELGADLQPVDKFDAKANADRQAVRESRKRLFKENAGMLEPGDVVESKGELVDRTAPYEEQQKTYELQAKNAENILDKGLFSLAASGGVGAGIAEGVVSAAEALPLVSQAMNSSDGFFGLTDNAAKEKALIWGKDWNRLDDAEKDRFRMLAKIDGMNALSSIKAPGKISTPLGDVGVSDAVRTTSSLATYLPVLGAGARTFAALGKNALPAAVIAAEFPDKAIEVAKGDKNVFEAVSELGIDAAGMRAIAPIMEKAVKVGEGAKTALGGQIKGGLTNIAGQTAVGIGQQAATALVQGRGNLSAEELGQNALTNIGLSLLDVRGGIKDARLQKDLEGYKRTAKPDIKTVGDDTYTKVDEVDGKVVVDVTKKDGTVERKEMPKKEWVLADTPHSFTSGKYVTDVPTVDHVISRGENKGKIVKGVLATDITGEQARAIDPYAFKKDNGYFIRLSHVERPEGYVAPDADIPTVGKLRKDFPGIQAAYSDLNGKPHMVVSKDMLAGLDGRDKVKAERALRKSGFEKIGNMFVYEYGDTLPSDFAPKQAPAEPKRIFDGYEFGIRQEGDKFIVEEGKNDIATFDDVDAAKGYVNKFERIPEPKVDNAPVEAPAPVDNIVTKPEELVDNKDEFIRYDPSTDRHNGKKLIPGDIIVDKNGNRFAVDRNSGFNLTIDAIENGKVTNKSYSLSVDPGAPGFANFKLTGENFYDKTKLGTGDVVRPVDAEGNFTTPDPVKITDVQEKDGVRYFKTEGSESYLPEDRVEPVQEEAKVTSELTKPEEVNVKVDEAAPTTDVGNKRLVVNPKDLKTHPDFQNRKEAFSKDTYDKIMAEGWNWDKYVPIKVWQDPKTNEYFTLNHTRRQAALDLGIDKLPVEVIEAKTFAEARDLARDSNNLGTPETPLERSGRYRDLWGTESNASIDKKAKQNEGNNKELVLALSRLDPQSKALQDLQLVDKSPDRDSYNQIEKYAKWTGKLQSYFSEFTRKQQNEVYEYLRDNKDVKSFDVLRDFVQRAYDKAYFEGFDANKSLNLKQAKDIHPEELRFNEKLNAAKAEYEQAKKEFESKKELAIAQGINVDSHPAVLQSAEYLRTAENAYRDLLRNKADILSKIRGEEQNLFGDERADSRASGGKISSDMKAKLVDLVDKGEYNKNNLAVGDRVYMYSDGEGNTMPSIGVIKEIGGIPVFYDYKTKRSSPIDENVTRVGQPHPYTEKGGRAIPYVIAQMANRLAKSFDGVNDYGLFRSKKKFGYFQGDNKKTSYGKTFVAINKSIFVDPNQVAQTLAHEIGHLIDYAGPELPGFSKGPGKTTGLFTTNRGGLKNRIKTLVDNLPVLDSELRRELEALSTEWSPFDPAANPNFTKYRYSAKELYAEFVSALLNEDMPLINRTAPKFYEAFMAKMAERPQVAEAYESLKADLDPNNPATWQAKLDNDLKVKAESNQHMRELRDEEKTSRKDVAKRPMQRFDYYSVIEKPLRDLERKAFDALKDAKVSEKERGLYLKAKQEIRDGVDVAANELLIAKQSSRLGEKGTRALALADKYIGESLYWHQGRTAVMNARLSPEAQAEIADKVESIFKPAREAGVDQYISSYLEQTAILGEHRKGKANPDFGNEFSAEKTLDAIRERIGDENYAVLEKTAKDFRDEQWRMLGEFKDAGLITEEQYLDLEKNADSYARFQSVLDDNLKPFYSRKGVSGMLDATKDVAVTGTIQMMTMKHAMLLNKVKQTTIELLGGTEAKVVNKNARTREERYGRQKYGQDVIDVYENGERKGYVVDQYVADIFNKAPFIVDKTWDWYTGWMNFQRTNLITLNAGWWMNNPLRDMMRLVKNVGFGALAEIPKSVKAAYKLQRGKATPLGDEAGKAGAINYRSRSSWIDGAEPLDKVLRSHEERVSGWQKIKNAAMKPLELQEAVNRLAGYSYARKKGMSPAEAAFHSRQFASTPDSSVSGYNSSKLNRALMFSKMTINGAMSDARILRNPFTQKGVVARAMITSIIPKVTQGLLAYGVLSDIADNVFGPDSEEADMIRTWSDLYAAIPMYDLQRFTVAPTDLSYDKDGQLKIKYLRFADDPNYTSISNMVLGLVGKVSQGEPGEAVTDVVDQWYQALPGAAPIIDASMAWFDYIVKGENPNDDFMKKDVIPIGEYAAVKGGSADERLISDAGKTMGLWTIQKIMGANYSLLKNTISGKDASWRFGVYADIPAYQTERKEIEGDARRESAEASLEANKVLDTKDVGKIEVAYNAGVLTERQYKRGLKEAGMSDEELYLRDKPTKVLLALQAQAKHRGLNTDYDLITKVLESRKKKSTFKGVGGNSGKSALLGK